MFNQGDKQVKNNGFLSANFLKVIAIITMTLDHFALLFIANDSIFYFLLRFIGRISAPIFFYFLVEGYHYTKNVNKYTGRLFAFALISYIPFIYFNTNALPNENSFLLLNVIYTLFIGFLALRAKNEITNIPLKVLSIFILFILSVPGDWNYIAVLIILIFDICYGNFKWLLIGYSLIVLFTSDILSNILNMFAGVPFSLNGFINVGMFLPLGFLKLYNGKKGRGGNFLKYSFYYFYPVHLLILRFIHTALEAF